MERVLRMSYQEKRSIVSMIMAIITLGAYGTYAYEKIRSGAIVLENMNFWASTMLVFVSIGIAATIVIQIIFHILLSVKVSVQENMLEEKSDHKEIERIIESEMVTDERDKLIELKTVRIGFIVVGIGFIAALVSQVITHSTAVMLNIMFVSFFAGSLVGSMTQLYYYRRGISNG